MNPHETLIRLRTPDASAGAVNQERRRYIGTLPRTNVRPLGSFSNYVCEELGRNNQYVMDGSMTAADLFALSEATFETVQERVVEGLFDPNCRAERRVALLDLVWMLRSLDIAHPGDSTYSSRKRRSRIYALARVFADMERRHPALSWSDIAIYHPVADPRTFLLPGAARDQEILMYRTQSAIEQIFRGIIEADWASPTPETMSGLVPDLRAALAGLLHFSRVRTVGQFDQIEPFLSPNFEFRGHATGAFSAWTPLVAIFLSGNRSFTRRLCDDTNRMAFDCDAHRYIDQVASGSFTPLADHIRAAAITPAHRTLAEEIHAEARQMFTAFLYSHRGAIKRHAPATFSEPSPADPPQTNAETIKEAIADMMVDSTKSGAAYR